MPMHGRLKMFERFRRNPHTIDARNAAPARPLGKMLRDRAGATAVALALSLSALAGFVGLGTEAASWYTTKRTMQGAADAAATAAALALAANEASSTFTNLARSIAASYNFVNGSNGTTV